MMLVSQVSSGTTTSHWCRHIWHIDLLMPNPHTSVATPHGMWMLKVQSAVAEDPRNGRIQVKTRSAHDVGYAINPVGCMQQIEGSVIMGLGHALMEEMIYEDGQL